MTLISKSASETKKIANKLAEIIKTPFVILLNGNLASGKTTFTQSLGKKLGITKQINSPSFVIMKEYLLPNNNYFYHLDLYRLDKNIIDWDIMDYYEDSIVVIEWPFNAKELLPKEYLLIDFELLDNDKRKLTITPNGKKYEEALKCIDF